VFDLIRHARETGQDPEALRERWGRLIDDFLRGRSEHTERSYRDSLQRLAGFSGCGSDMDALMLRLLGDGMGAANDLVLRWKRDMVERKLSPATVNLRLTAARSLVRLARTIGLVQWTLEVKGEASRAYRDTAGPPREGVLRLMALVKDRPRDLALLRLLFDLGLRRKEVVGLDVSDVDITGEALWILGKGKREKELVYPSRSAWVAFRSWLSARDSVVAQGEAAVFLSLGRRRRGRRIRTDSVTRLVRGFGEAIGIRVTPHALRHSATTALLDEVQGDTRIAQAFGRWAKRETAERYDDNRRKPSRDLSQKVSDWLDHKEGTA
jgi:integrase